MNTSHPTVKESPNALLQQAKELAKQAQSSRRGKPFTKKREAKPKKPVEVEVPEIKEGAQPAKSVAPSKKDLGEEGKFLLSLYNGDPLDPEERKKKKLVSKAKAMVRSKVLQAREDPNAFVEYCFCDSEKGAPFEQADIHRELQEIMASGEDCVNLLPRDHGKTSQLEAHVIWQLGNNPNLRLKIVCASDAKAVERLFAVIQHLKTNEKVRSVFPWLKPAKLGDWSKHKIVVERPHISRDASVEALGVLSTATGGRADILYADDVVDRRNALELPKLRETVKSAWDSDWSNLLEPGGQIVYNATPWHTADLTHKLEKNLTYRVLRRPVGDASDPFRSVWEEKWPSHELKKRRLKIGQLEYDRGFRLIALSGEFTTVNGDWILYWDAPPDVGALQVFIAFDLSSGEGKDWFACCVVGVDPETLQVYVLEAWHAKLTFLGRAQAVEQTVRRWQPQIVGIEQETMKSLTQYLDETTLLSILPLRPHLAKAMRLMSVTPPMERGQVLFNPALNPEKIRNRDEHGDVVGELTEFPLGANDDLVDAFVYSIMLAQSYGGIDSDEGIALDVSVIGSTRSEDTGPIGNSI